MLRFSMNFYKNVDLGLECHLFFYLNLGKSSKILIIT